MSLKIGYQTERFDASGIREIFPDKTGSIAPIHRMYVRMDGAGVPVVRKETTGRQGKGKDGTAKTRVISCSIERRQ